jgi:hypothetical protein
MPTFLPFPHTFTEKEIEKARWEVLNVLNHLSVENLEAKKRKHLEEGYAKGFLVPPCKRSKLSPILESANDPENSSPELSVVPETPPPA